MATSEQLSIQSTADRRIGLFSPELHLVNIGQHMARPAVCVTPGKENTEGHTHSSTSLMDSLTLPLYGGGRRSILTPYWRWKGFSRAPPKTFPLGDLRPLGSAAECRHRVGTRCVCLQRPRIREHVLKHWWSLFKFPSVPSKHLYLTHALKLYPIRFGCQRKNTV